MELTITLSEEHFNKYLPKELLEIEDFSISNYEVDVLDYNKRYSPAYASSDRFEQDEHEDLEIYDVELDFDKLEKEIFEDTGCFIGEKFKEEAKKYQGYFADQMYKQVLNYIKTDCPDYE